MKLIKSLFNILGIKKSKSIADKHKANKKMKYYRREKKRECLQAYSKTGKVECSCGCHTLSELELDHINYGGNNHRRKLFNGQNKGGYDLYCRLSKAGYPDKKEYQILCKTCNLKKGGKK